MKKRFNLFALSLTLLVGGLLACTTGELPSPEADATTQTSAIDELPSPGADATTPTTAVQPWQDAYAELLRTSDSKEFDLFDKEFYLCDIDGDGTPELLVGGLNMNFSVYDAYTYRNNATVHIGVLGSTTWSRARLDNNGGILIYSNLEETGKAHRYHIYNNVLRYDDEFPGYYHNLNQSTSPWGNTTALESYVITEINIAKVIYGGV